MDGLNIGQRLRAIREERKLSLRALADLCGMSFNTISRIERNETSPTVATLHLLAKALNVSINQFFEDNYERSVVLVRHPQRMHSSSENVIIESLGAGLRDQQIAPFVMTIEPAGCNRAKQITHQGEEFVYCLVGKITYEIGDEVYELEADDSLLFDASLPHAFCNNSETTAQFIVVFNGLDGDSIDHHYRE
jgi:transcriptional regulator with XRE-family HTH domain